MTQSWTPPSVVVGIDGSRAAVGAALWAVDEAIGRGMSLRLLSAAESDARRETAEAAVRSAAAAVESSGRSDLPEVQTAVVTASPAAVLLEASHAAAIICVGLVGLRHFDPARRGSTVGALLAAPRCPLAVVRSGKRPASARPGWVVAELNQAQDGAAVLQSAVDEARMRGAPLRVLGTWQSGDHGSQSASESDRLVRTQLDRRLETWAHRYPDLDVTPVAVRGSGLAYLADNAGSIQLVVIGAHNTAGVGELLGPAGLAALHDTDCSVLVVDAQRML